MTEFASGSLDDAELTAEFDRLFPEGFAGSDVLRELAPGGWENSPLHVVFHPSLDQVHEELVRSHRNLAQLQKPDERRPATPEPTLEEVTKYHFETPVETARELRELVGQCLWDVFSDNHEVFAPDGRVVDLGSFRFAGEFLADPLNRQIGSACHDYLDFYLGTIRIAHRADLGPAYQMIFRRIHNRQLDWVYRFPRLYAIDMAPLKDALDQKSEPDWLNYSPSEALAKEEERQQRERQVAELRESLDEGYHESLEEALKSPPPTIVEAYRVVYGNYPDGWPPSP